MTVFNKRNALVGFLTLKFAERRLRRNKLRRKAPKIALFSLVGLGVIVGIVAVVLRRRGDEDFARLGEEQDSEIVGEYVTASSSPIPAT
jgi:uncharacterized membrane protein